MADEERTIEEEIEDLLGDETPAQDQEEELVEELEDETPSGDEEGEVAEEEEGVEEIVAEEEPEEDATDESEPIDEVEEEEVEEVVEEVEDEGEDAEKDQDLESFRNQMNRIAQAALEQGVQLPADLLGISGEDAPTDSPDKPKSPPQEAPPEQPQGQLPEGYDSFDILTEGVDFDEFMEDKDKFVGGMRGILQRHEQMLAQRFMQVLPGIVQQQTKQIMTLQNAADKFYRANEDLEPVRATVGAVANQIAAKNPQWDLDKVLVESAKTTRKLLKMPSPGKGKRVVKPSFVKAKGQSRKVAKVKKSKLQKEIDDLLI